MNFKYTPNTLKKVESILEEAGYILRYEKGNFNSGYCLLEHKKVVVINKFLNIEGRINALIEIIPSIAVSEEAFSTEGLKFYKSIMAGVAAEADDETEPLSNSEETEA
jgi:hypothetical protein